MVWFQYAFLLTGIGLVAWGWRRNSRNRLLAGAIALFLGGTFVELATGFGEGFRQAQATHHALEQEHAPAGRADSGG